MVDSSGTRYAMMKQSRSSSDLPASEGIEAYVDEYSRAIAMLPGQLAPLLGHVQRLDVHFCTDMRTLHALRDEYKTAASARDRRAVLGTITRKLIEMQSTSDAKLAHTGEMTAMTRVRVSALDACVTAIDAPKTNNAVGKRFATRPGVRRSYAETPPSVNGDKLVDLLSRVASKRERRAKQFGPEFVRHSPTLPTPAPPTKRPPPAVVAARIDEDDGNETESDTKSASPAPRRPPPRRKTKRRAPVVTPTVANDKTTENGHATSASTAPATKRRRETTNRQTLARKSASRSTQPPVERPESSSRRSQRTQQTQSAASSSNATENNEERWCLCDRVSFGEMIGCDHHNCPIEWFHFECVRLTAKPKGGKWFCPSCRTDKPKPVRTR